MDQNQSRDKNNIERLLTKQLYQEYEHILYSYNLKLQTPNIIITKTKSNYGSWCPKTRAISLSSSLIWNYPWNYTLEILKHEIAHQYVHEILKKDESHGTHFKKSCDILRVKPWAQKACINLDQCLYKVSEGLTNLTEDKPVRLVKKLLSLSASSNKHEAILAIKKASEIAQKYQINPRTLKCEEHFTTLTMETGRKKIHSYETLIGSILISHFRVKIIYSSLFNLQKLQEEKTIEILGNLQNTKMAEYVFIFLSQQLKSLWEEHKLKTKTKGLRLKHQFYFGVLDGFQTQLTNHKSQHNIHPTCTKTSVSLYRHDRKLLEYTKYQYPKLVHSKQTGHIIKSNEYSAGFTKGSKIKIRQPISNQSMKRLS